MRALWDELDDDKSGQIGLEEIDKVRSGSEDRSGRKVPFRGSCGAISTISARQR